MRFWKHMNIDETLLGAFEMYIFDDTVPVNS